MQEMREMKGELEIRVVRFRKEKQEETGIEDSIYYMIQF